MTAARVRRAIERAIAERDAGMAAAEAGDLLEWNGRLIDQAIDAFAEAGRPFSANHLRELLPDVGQQIGSRFSKAYTEGRIVWVGDETSLLASTHCKRIGLWRGARAQAELLAVGAEHVDALVVAAMRILAEAYGPVTTNAGAARRRRIGEQLAAVARETMAGSRG